jgi:hypothetical protein
MSFMLLFIVLARSVLVQPMVIAGALSCLELVNHDKETIATE